MAAVKEKKRRKPEAYWPVPAIPHRIPSPGTPGSFSEDRGDRIHCGVDLYAPTGSIVVAVEAGAVAATGISTSPEILPYWNLTSSVTVAAGEGRVWRYGELAAVLVSEGDRVTGGQVIGTVGQVLNCRKVGRSAPPYIRELCRGGAASMLHWNWQTGSPMRVNPTWVGTGSGSGTGSSPSVTRGRS